MTAGSQSGTRVHVLVIAALQDELEGLKAVADGAVGAWKQHKDSAGFVYHVREFTHASGGVLRVAVARPVDMGGASASNVATRLVRELRPVCLAMSGICAGRREEVSLGDVIVASRLFDAEAGKLKATSAAGKRVEEMSHATTTFNLDPRWQQSAEDWPRAWCAPWQAQRPRTLVAQGDWLLDALRRFELGQGESPEVHPERWTRCPSWKKVIARLRKRGLVTRAGFKLTKKGRDYVDDQWLLYGNRMPDEAPLRVHVGPMGTVGNVKEDPELFGKLLRVQRKLVAVDMESVAIGLVAAQEKIPYTLVVKAVQDYADDDKDDSLRDFGARVAAAFLLDFLRENLPVDALGPQSPTLKDRLSSGQAELRSVATPATYLVARHQVVPFAGRADELAILDTWAGSDDAVRVLLVHGPAGMGKTRLLTEWLARYAARHPGDAIGFLTGALDDAAIDALCASERAVVVIDYAEERAGLDALLTRVGALAMQRASGRHVRLVLLARNAGDWWASLRGRSSDMAALLCEEPFELAPLTAATQDARLAEYHRAHAALVHTLQRRPVDARPAIVIVTHLDAEPDLRAEHFERPLYVHMAALTAVLGKPQAGSPRDILDEILDHEQRYWARYLGIEPDGDEWRNRVEQVRQVAAAMVVRGACAREDLPAVMQSLGLPDDGRIRALLQDLYPDPDPARSRAWVVPVEPDLVAEALLCSVLERRGRPEEWLVKALTGIAPRHWEHAFTVLGRMGMGHDDAMASVGTGAARALLWGDVPGRAEAAFDAALALTEHTAHSDLGRTLADALSNTEHIAVARALDGRVPKETVSLRELAVRVDEILLASLGEDDDLEEHARRNNNLGARYSALGKREEALAATARAVERREELAAKRPDAFLPNLAASLNNLGNNYSELGKWEQALAATARAVEIREELVDQHPDAFLPDLAMSLNNLGNRYSALGRGEEALAATARAVEIRERLAAKRPDAFLPALAMSLNNLGNRYSALGRREEALAATARAVKLYEELAARRPDAFLPDLAASLNNLGNRYSELGRQEEALTTTKRVVKLYEELAAKRPDAFLPDLAASLNNLGDSYRELGRREEALAATARAVEIREELAARRPDAFLPDLAASLNNLGNSYSEQGRREEALATTARAVRLYEELAAKHRDAFFPDLATSLNNLGVRYREQGMREEALAATERAVEIHEELAAKRPDAFLPDLATSLTVRSQVHSSLGHGVLALRDIVTAVGHLWPHFERLPAAFAGLMGVMLQTYRNYLSRAEPDEIMTERLRRYAELIK